MVTLPPELWLKVFHYLDLLEVAQFSVTSKYFLDISYSMKYTRCCISCYQDIMNLKRSLESKLISNRMDVLIIEYRIHSRDLLRIRSIIGKIHVVNLVLDYPYLELIRLISHEHLVLPNEAISYNSESLQYLYESPGTLEFAEAIISITVLNRLLPKLRNTYSYIAYQCGCIKSTSNINDTVAVPFRIWSGPTDITNLVMIQVRAYLNVEPTKFIFIESLQPMMCWQDDSKDAPHMARHVSVIDEFEQIYPEIQSIRVESIQVGFSSEISKSNMSRVSTIYLYEVYNETIDLIKMYPSVKAVYRLPDKAINLLYGN